MKKITLVKFLSGLAMFAGLSLSGGAARADVYEIDSGHSAAQFSVRHMMVANVRGEFGKVTGTVNIDDKDIAKSTVEATIDASTVSTRNADRDGHLKSPDFFNVAQFPTITFKSKKVEAAGAGKLKVTGDLTMHGVTKQVVLDVNGPTPVIKDPFGNMKRGAEATTKLSRKDFGLSWNKALEAGGVAVGDEVSITLDVELIKKK
jgi:polyisoprenoid-binding protein YceI